MPEITGQAIGGPYCGESITVLADNSLPKQEYIEDSQVCCRPMVLHVLADAAVTAGAAKRSPDCLDILLIAITSQTKRKGSTKGPIFRVVALT